MSDAFTFELPLWEIAVRGTVVYLAMAVILRLVPKRHTGDLSPNDLITLVLVGHLAASAVLGEATSIADILLMLVVVLLWDYAFNVLEYKFPRLRGVVQDTPTLLIHEGEILRENLRREKLTEEELAASLRRHGVADVSRVRQAVLEVDGHISVIEKEDG